VALICDTGPLYAGMDRADTDHETCKQLLSGSSERLLVPAPVVVELEWLASSRLGLAPFSSFLADVEAGNVTIVDLIRADYLRIRELLTRYADLKLGFVDAAVVAIVERLNEHKLATLDHRHFTTIRAKHADAIELLPH
jgi:predicted nucleic acid-binding protein